MSFICLESYGLSPLVLLVTVLSESVVDADTMVLLQMDTVDFVIVLHNLCQSTMKMIILMGITPRNIYAMTLIRGYKCRSNLLLSHLSGTWPVSSHMKYSLSSLSALSVSPCDIPKKIKAYVPNTM